ncbi:MAG TPA: hypothetical protein VG944_10125 [Fimbriimonas sp.]|nr:hypothetical protein [Fimbriimonas sp.]
MKGTPKFFEQFGKLKSEIEDESERQSFELQARICFRLTEEKIHRWPWFDKRDGIATFSAVFGPLNLSGVYFRYFMVFEKRSMEGQLEPFWLWIWKEKL